MVAGGIGFSWVFGEDKDTVPLMGMVGYCSDTPSPYQEQLPMNPTETRDYTVEGMTCSH